MLPNRGLEMPDQTKPDQTKLVKGRVLRDHTRGDEQVRVNQIIMCAGPEVDLVDTDAAAVAYAEALAAAAAEKAKG